MKEEAINKLEQQRVELVTLVQKERADKQGYFSELVQLIDKNYDLASIQELFARMEAGQIQAGQF